MYPLYVGVNKQVGHCHDKNWYCFILTWMVPFLIAGHIYNIVPSSVSPSWRFGLWTIIIILLLCIILNAVVYTYIPLWCCSDASREFEDQSLDSSNSTSFLANSSLNRSLLYQAYKNHNNYNIIMAAITLIAIYIPGCNNLVSCPCRPHP